MDSTELFNRVKQIRNRAEIILMLEKAYPLEQIKHVLPTALEDMHYDSQKITTEYCIDDGLGNS